MAEDRWQVAEDRWRSALEKHDIDPLAHARERHDQNNEWVARWVIPTRQEIVEEGKARKALEELVKRQERLGYEIRGGLIVLGAFLSGGLITVIAHLVRVI